MRRLRYAQQCQGQVDCNTEVDALTYNMAVTSVNNCLNRGVKSFIGGSMVKNGKYFTPLFGMTNLQGTVGSKREFYKPCFVASGFEICELVAQLHIPAMYVLSGLFAGFQFDASYIRIELMDVDPLSTPEKLAMFVINAGAYEDHRIFTDPTLPAFDPVTDKVIDTTEQTISITGTLPTTYAPTPGKAGFQRLKITNGIPNNGPIKRAYIPLSDTYFGIKTLDFTIYNQCE